METLLAFDNEQEAREAYYHQRVLDLSPFDPETGFKYQLLDSAYKNIVINNIHALTNNRQHMGENLHQVLKQFESTTDKIKLSPASRPLKYQSPENKNPESDLIREITSDNEKEPDTFAEFLAAYDDLLFPEKYENASEEELDYLPYSDITLDRTTNIRSLYRTATFRPYKRRRNLENAQSSASDMNYVFAELICLYLGIDLDVIYHGIGKAHTINGLTDNDKYGWYADSMFQEWDDLAEECDVKYAELLTKKHNVTLDDFPHVNFESVYEDALGEKATTFYAVIKKDSAPLLLSSKELQAVTTLIHDLAAVSHRH